MGMALSVDDPVDIIIQIFDTNYDMNSGVSSHDIEQQENGFYHTEHNFIRSLLSFVFLSTYFLLK